MNCKVSFLMVVIVLAAGFSVAQAQVFIDTVTIGDVGNEGDPSGESEPGGHGDDRTVGAVNYIYAIGKSEVTAGQYTAFLNAVARTDTYGLYMEEMRAGDGSRILQEGASGSYTYSVAPDWANHPVNHIHLANAKRFANWLHNGQPEGLQDLTTTEDGSYFLDGRLYWETPIMYIPREPDATWVIPSEDEWYKAAYYNPITNGFYDYPTGTDNLPDNSLVSPDPGNNANYHASSYTVDWPHWLTDVAEFENSKSPYGTYDQGGNVFEWTQSLMLGPSGEEINCVRGGSYSNPWEMMQAAWRGSTGHTDHAPQYGFRVARLIPQVSAYDEQYCIQGNSGGVAYSWWLDEGGDGGNKDNQEPFDLNADALPVGADAEALALAFAISINAVVPGVANADGHCFSLDIAPPISLLVGPAGGPADCPVDSAGCSYNPSISLVLPTSSAIPLLGRWGVIMLIISILVAWLIVLSRKQKLKQT